MEQDTRKVLSLEEWNEFVSKNSTLSYSLVTCLCILCIWEAGCRTKEEANAELHRHDFGISGAQAEMAIEYALHYVLPDELLDDTMIKISRDRDLTFTEKVGEGIK